METSFVPSSPDIMRRVVLVDFDWDDADLVPELLSHRGLSVRLVAGADAGDPGVRLAELCGLPRTLDLADLTREIFDLALVSGRSPRRGQVEGLLSALGTPSLTPQEFVGGAEVSGDSGPAAEAVLLLQAKTLDSALGFQSLEVLVDMALSESVSVPAVTPEESQAVEAPDPAPLESIPEPEDRAGMEAHLRRLIEETGATRAEFHLASPLKLAIVAEAGPTDALLSGLVERAEVHGSPQVVASAVGPAPKLAWGAWSFRTSRRRGVVAAGGVVADRWPAWERAVEEMAKAWNQRERRQAGPGFPMMPAAQTGWLDPPDFALRLELAAERHRRDGLRFALHRLDLPISTAAADLFARRLPGHLRDTDSICRPTPQRVLLLTATPQDRFPYVRGRLAALWQEAWIETGNERPVPGMSDERSEMTSAEEVESFLAQGRTWLGVDAG